MRLLIKTCHKRGVHAMGGMAAQIPIKNDPAANEAALAKVRADGVAGEHGEVTAGLASVGAAVLDHLGWPAAAIAMTFAEDAPAELVDGATAAVQEAAATLSRRIRGIR